ILCAHNVCRLEAFGALQQIKLHGFALVERTVAVLLYRGEVYKHILPRGALDKTISFRPVEPLDCTFLSHGRYSFSIAKNKFPESPIEAPNSRGTPSSIRGTRLRPDLRQKGSQKKRLLNSAPR